MFSSYRRGPQSEFSATSCRLCRFSTKPILLWKDLPITLRDGKVLRDEPLESVYRQDLKEFKTSALGQAVLEGAVPPDVGELAPLMPQLQEALAKA